MLNLMKYSLRPKILVLDLSKCCRQCAGLGWTFLLKKNGPDLFTTLTTICMGPLVAGRKCWENEEWSLSLPKNNID